MMSDEWSTTGQEGSGEPGAMFEFDPQGLLVSPDDADNPDGHVVPHHEAGTKVSFAVWNLGGAAGQCTVGIEVDGAFIAEWTSGVVPPQGSASPPEVRGIGRYGVGEHQFLAYLNPGTGRNDHISNRIAVA